MAREKKLTAPVTLFAAIESDQHEALREMAFAERRSIADLVREALDEFLQRRKVSSERGHRPRASRNVVAR